MEFKPNHLVQDEHSLVQRENHPCNGFIKFVNFTSVHCGCNIVPRKHGYYNERIIRKSFANICDCSYAHCIICGSSCRNLFQFKKHNR